MTATIAHSEYGDRLKKPPNRFFDILIKRKLGIENHLRKAVKTVNLGGIAFQRYPLKN